MNELYAVQLTKTIVVYVEADSREEAEYQAREDDAGSGHQREWLHVLPDATVVDQEK
jgi:hypothetical protein